MILMHIPDKEKQKAIEKVCKTLKQPVMQITTADAGRTLGSILGGKKENIKVPPLYQLPELIVFAGLPDQILDRFLAAYKTAGIAPVPLKAVVTPYNIGWTLKDLATELKKEHHEMSS